MLTGPWLRVVYIISRVALYQASIGGLWTICRLSVGRPVCLSAKCIVAKRLSGSGCRWDGEWVGRGMGVLDRGGDRRRGRGSFEGEFGASRCNQRGLSDAALPKLLWVGLVPHATTDHSFKF